MARNPAVQTAFGPMVLATSSTPRHCNVGDDTPKNKAVV